MKKVFLQVIHISSSTGLEAIVSMKSLSHTMTTSHNLRVTLSNSFMVIQKGSWGTSHTKKQGNQYCYYKN